MVLRAGQSPRRHGCPSVGLARQVEGMEIRRKIVRGKAIEMEDIVERAKRKPSSSS
jgi:hypothetical protein